MLLSLVLSYSTVSLHNIINQDRDPPNTVIKSATSLGQASRFTGKLVDDGISQDPVTWPSSFMPDAICPHTMVAPSDQGNLIMGCMHHSTKPSTLASCSIVIQQLAHSLLFRSNPLGLSPVLHNSILAAWQPSYSLQMASCSACHATCVCQSACLDWFRGGVMYSVSAVCCCLLSIELIIPEQHLNPESFIVKDVNNDNLQLKACVNHSNECAPLLPAEDTSHASVI